MAWTDRSALLLRAAADLALVGAPVYWWQGRRLRQRLPRLEEAPGERVGRHAGATPPLRLVGVGESPMAGVGLTAQSQALIARTAEHLARATGRMVEWESAARSGATAAQVRRELVPTLRPEPADAVVVALGVNDCLSLHGAKRWERDLNELIAALRDRLSPATIVLAGIPPMQAFPALPKPLSTLLGLRAALLDSASRRMAKKDAGLVHGPMALDARRADLFCIDGFHPNAEGHARWAEQLADTLAPLLDPPR